MDIRLLCLALALLTGCGSAQDKWTKARPATTEVCGTLLLDGQPLDAAIVNLIAVDGKHSAYATTDAHGQFDMTTFVEGDGAVPGDYKVTITKRKVDFKPNPEAPNILPPLYYKAEELVHKDYASVDTTPVTAHIEMSGNNNFSFEISSKGTAK